MNIVLIETSGNQRYIFATNKLRENVGASELTYQVGTRYVLEAVEGHTGQKLWEADDADGSKQRANLGAEANNPRIESPAAKIEVVVATSGKAILLVKEKSVAERLVAEVTQRALETMPGLTVHGAVCQTDDNLDAADANGGLRLHEAIGKVHRKLESIRYGVPSNEQRFLRLPFVAPCETSGLPASEVRFFTNEDRKGKKGHPLSQVTSAKREARDKPSRIIDLIQASFNHGLPEKDSIALLKDLEKLESYFENKFKWLGVIHADGNGVGAIFLDFLSKSQATTGRDYINQYREFSIELDVCTVKAACIALNNLKNKFKKDEGTGATILPIVPLVLGGDDLTVLCAGKYALRFTHDFLTEFEKQTSQNDIIKGIAYKTFGVDRLGICAGVAIIKPHYPFHQAYELAERLLKSAKQVKEQITHTHEGKKVALPASALDFHILYDSAHSELSEIRDGKMKVANEETYLFAKPYVVTTEDNLSSQGPNQWLKYRKFGELKKRINAMTDPASNDTTRRALPNSKLHEIRQSLFRGKDLADAEARLIRNRLEGEAKKVFGEKVLIDKESLFFIDESGKSFTHFLDAIEAFEFWEGFDRQNAGQQSESEDDK